MGKAHIRSIVGALAGAAVLVPSAQGALVVNTGLAGVRLQMTQAKVRTILGPPAATRTEPNPFVGRVVVHTYRGLTIHYFAGRVGNMVTTRMTERTKSGIGVGSTEARVRSRIGGVTCEATVGTARLCRTGKLRVGSHVTTFDIRNGKVWRVRVGIVMD